jgi:heme O synthase-like polyprenyltransferase
MARLNRAIHFLLSAENRFTLMNRLQLYLRLVRLDKPIGTLLLLWPTLSALWLASGGVPDWHLLVIFTLGTFLMRSAGCAINDFADRDIDRHVKRTAERPLTTGRIRSRRWPGRCCWPTYSGRLLMTLNMRWWIEMTI